MNYTKQQFVQLPVNLIKSDALKPLDLFIYLIIRSYMNNKTKKCFPSMDTLVENAQTSKPTIIKSINLLETNNFIKVERSVGKNNTYCFPNHDRFEIFSYDFLFSSNILKEEKLLIISLQHYMIKDKKGEGKVCYSDDDIAIKINSSKSLVKKANNSLSEKSLVTINHNNKIYSLSELGQSIIWNLDRHDKQITKNEIDINELRKTVKKQNATINSLKKIVVQKNKKEIKDKNVEQIML